MGDLTINKVGVANRLPEDASGIANVDMDRVQEIHDWIHSALDENIRLSDCFQTIDVKMVFKGDWLALIAEFFTSEYQERSIIRQKIAEVSKESITKWLESIKLGVQVVNKLNQRVAQLNTENQILISIKYQWSEGEICEIHDWDYDRITVKLGRSAVQNLLAYSKDLDDLVQYKPEESNSIVNFTKQFNEISIHQKIGARLKDETIYGKLYKNMLCFKDVLDYIDTKNKGVQKLKIVLSIRDLSVVGIFYWTIDYRAQQFSVYLQDDRLISLDDGSFIRDRDLCDGVTRSMMNKVRDKLKWVDENNNEESMEDEQ